jgi:hypothetical protein
VPVLINLTAMNIGVAHFVRQWQGRARTPEPAFERRKHSGKKPEWRVTVHTLSTSFSQWVWRAILRAVK